MYLSEKPGWQRQGWQNRLSALRMLALGILSPKFETPVVENKVAYLDGLRGFAAFLVYWFHHSDFTHWLETRYYHAYGYMGSHYFASLPIIRYFFAGGNSAVALFFVISGYVLSVSLLSNLHSRNVDGLRLSMQLGASFPRRWVRLYLPVLITTFCFMTSWHIFGIRTINAERAPTWFAEVQKWFYDFRRGSYFYLTSDIPGFALSQYNVHVWSIAAEFRGSAIVYVTTLVYFALGYGPYARICATTGLVCYFALLVDAPWYALFAAGMLLCDLDLTREHHPDQLPRWMRSTVFEHRRWTWAKYALLLSALYVACPPIVDTAEQVALEPGWYYLSFFLPKTVSSARWWYTLYGAPVIVWCIPRIPALKRMFESAGAQFLGKVSFGFYLVHGPILWTIGDRIYSAVGRATDPSSLSVPTWINTFPLPDLGPLGMEFNAVVPHLILLPLTLYGAVIVTKLIDGPSVKLSKWLFKQSSTRPNVREGGKESLPLLPQHIEKR